VSPHSRTSSSGSILLALCLASSRGGSSDAATARRLTGTYLWTHTVQELGDEGWFPVDVTDTLRVRPVPRGGVRFAFFLTANNGHSCEMEGKAYPTAHGLEFRQRLEDGVCVLRFHFHDQAVTLEDVDEKCRSEWCGVRGSIDGVTFSRLPKGTT
jgi:hypothetical protein